jgi:hypothetical protein
MAKKPTRKRPPDVAAHRAALDAFNLFGKDDDVAAIEEWTPPLSRPKPDYVVTYEYTGPCETPKADMDALWGAIEALADADPTPSPWKERGT